MENSNEINKLETLRHSTAHVMADAVKSLFPEAKITIGPSIEAGFYYDFDMPKPFSDEDLPRIEAKMDEIIAQNLPFERIEVTRNEARKIFDDMGETYKLELLDAIPENETVTIYKHGNFMDLCRGPHVESTGRIKAFKLLSIAGAYWRGDEKNKMLQRIYGTAFEDRKALKAHLAWLEEAAKRDHRKLGRELDLFSINETIGGGLVLWHPKGGKIRQLLEDFWRSQHEKHGYDIVFTPHIARDELWHQSGHLGFYKESMFDGMEVDGQQYLVKPMNCPFHIQIYKTNMHSYRDFPYRWAELGTVYRYERSGALHGLFRVRGFTQDDAHIYMRHDQMKYELHRVFKFSLNMLKAFGFENFVCRLSTKPAGKYVGTDEIWANATEVLREVLTEWGGEYEVDEGGGAFYGPKIDIALKDSLNREWQCSTIQLDFNLPDRFDMTYISPESTKVRPIMVHRALLGSIERFFGILIEHFAGKFPMWLAPEQVRVVTVTNDQDAWAEEVVTELKKAGYRATADMRNEKLSYKIREAQVQKVPCTLVLGAKEVENRTVTPRYLGGNSESSVSIEDFLNIMSLKAASPVIE
ncbi:threonine--tRNA ligase [Myxococcota bacterium]|nr:threonine--tRNA ligase [Myxococcota bacterium]MBU1381715.1 threonine--tRNA ligase [Myxococcota bacterium]MBU1497477.1 threonine--tRNA ligase [Myxococcota bacterium]